MRAWFSTILVAALVAASASCRRETRVLASGIHALDDGAVMTWVRSDGGRKVWMLGRIDGRGEVLWETPLPGVVQSGEPGRGLHVGRHIVAVRYANLRARESRLAGLDLASGVQRWDALLTELPEQASAFNGGIPSSFGGAYAGSTFAIGVQAPGGSELVAIDEDAGLVTDRIGVPSFAHAAIARDGDVFFPAAYPPFVVHLRGSALERARPRVEHVGDGGSVCVTADGFTFLSSPGFRHELIRVRADRIDRLPVTGLGALDLRKLFLKRCGSYRDGFVFLQRDPLGSSQVIVLGGDATVRRVIELPLDWNDTGGTDRGASDGSLSGALTRYVPVMVGDRPELVIVDLETGLTRATGLPEPGSIVRRDKRWYCASDDIGHPAIAVVDGDTGEVRATVEVGDNTREVATITSEAVGDDALWTYIHEWEASPSFVALDLTSLEPRVQVGVPVQATARASGR